MLGFIGAGNMATAIISGIINNAFMSPESIIVSDVIKEKCSKLQSDYHVGIAGNNQDLIERCDRILVAVKPIYMDDVLSQAKPFLQNKVLISIVTGWSHERIKMALGDVHCQVLCVMPNTPAAVSTGMTALYAEHSMSADELSFAERLFSSIGKTVMLPERLISGFVAIGGSGPAYVYMMIEALADAAVKEGLGRAEAYQIAAQTVKGAAEMVLVSGMHPGELKDAVCSPAGTTIEAVIELEKGGMRAALMRAVAANADKARQLSGNAK